jgi:hypothetical protein
MLGGVVRVLISMIAIMICATGFSCIETPYKIATLFERVVGKAVFGLPDVYDLILEMKGIATTPPKSITMRGIQTLNRSPLVTLEPSTVLETFWIVQKHTQHSQTVLLLTQNAEVF